MQPLTTDSWVARQPRRALGGSGVHNIGIMEKKMETTRGLGFRVYGGRAVPKLCSKRFCCASQSVALLAAHISTLKPHCQELI